MFFIKGVKRKSIKYIASFQLFWNCAADLQVSCGTCRGRLKQILRREGRERERDREREREEREERERERAFASRAFGSRGFLRAHCRDSGWAMCERNMLRNQKLSGQSRTFLFHIMLCHHVTPCGHVVPSCHVIMPCHVAREIVGICGYISMCPRVCALVWSMSMTTWRGSFR